jgi:hypothetical protein
VEQAAHGRLVGAQHRLERVAHRPQVPGARRAVAGCRAEGRRDLAVGVAEHLEEERALRAEEAHDVRLGDAGALRDGGGGGADVAVRGEHVERRAHDEGAPVVGGDAAADLIWCGHLLDKVSVDAYSALGSN